MTFLSCATSTSRAKRTLSFFPLMWCSPYYSGHNSSTSHREWEILLREKSAGIFDGEKSKGRRTARSHPWKPTKVLLNDPNFFSVKKLLHIVRRNYLVKFCQWYYVTLQKWTFSIPTLHENWPKITVIWKLLICKSFHNLPHPIELATVHMQVLWNLIFWGKSFLNSFRGCVYYSDLAVGQ